MLPCGERNVNYGQQFAIVRTRLQWLYLVLGLIAAFCVPLVGSGPLMNFLVYLGISIVATLGLMLLSGYCGQFSMGHAAFMAIGAFGTALLVQRGVNFFGALLLSALIAAGTGVIFGLPSRRVKEFYLVLSTLAAQFIIIYVITGWFKGDVGVHLPPVSVGGISFTGPDRYWYVVLVFLIVLTFFAKNLTRTRIGRAWIAIRDNDIAAEAMGINVYGYKLLAFATGCFYAGIAGGLWAGFVNFATTDHYTLVDSIWYLGIIFIGGLGSIMGVFWGALFVRGIKELAYYLAPIIGGFFPPGSAIAQGITLCLPYLFFGLALAFFMIYEPRGLAHRWELLKAWGRLHPWGYW